MGQIVRQDLGISIEVELQLLEQIKQEIKISEGWERELLIMAGSYAAIC